LLHSLFNSETRMAAARVVNRMRLFEAGVKCTGGSRDEKLVAEISKVLLNSGKRPMLSKSGRSKRRRLDLEMHGSLRVQAEADSSDRKTSASGRFQSHSKEMEGEYIHPSECLSNFLTQLPDERRHARVSHEPTALDKSAQTALRQAALPARQKESKQEIQSLPVFARRGRSAAISQTQSSARQSLATWLQSDEGQEWQSARRQLWDPFCSEQHTSEAKVDV
jgi:hypothetical protein